MIRSKYKVVTKNRASFTWSVNRGCEGDGNYQKANIFGLEEQTVSCTRENGTLCNEKFGSYEMDTEVSTQTLKPLKCFVCSTGFNNTDQYHECYTKEGSVIFAFTHKFSSSLNRAPFVSKISTKQ